MQSSRGVGPPATGLGDAAIGPWGAALDGRSPHLGLPPPGGPGVRRELRRLPDRAATGPALQVLDTGGELDLLIHPPPAPTRRLPPPMVFFSFPQQVLPAGGLAVGARPPPPP